MPTISVRRYDYQGLKARLKQTDRIAIVSCDSCARESDGLGGESGLQALAGKLESDGFNVLLRELLPVACSPDRWRELVENEAVRRLLDQADVLIALSCEAGERRAAETAGSGKLLSVTKTLGKGAVSPEKGALLTEPTDGVDIEIDDPEGLPISDAAKRLGLYPGSF